jgi:aerobic-type carbon monoxide dehydrogenase small subunit (CoxS/CutS family)
MHETIELGLAVNGRRHELRIEPRETLAEVLRDRLALTGTKVSCDAQVCGACTVLVDGLAVSACSYLEACSTLSSRRSSTTRRSNAGSAPAGC